MMKIDNFYKNMYLTCLDYIFIVKIIKKNVNIYNIKVMIVFKNL